MFVILFKLFILNFLLKILDQGSQYYQQPAILTLDPVAFVQAINTDYSVSAPLALPTNLTNYQVKI
jgi:hypothetical protein